MVEINANHATKYDKLHRVIYWRREAKMTQSDMAKAIGTTRSYYCRKENGHIEPSRNEMIEILNAINLKLSEAGKENVTLDQLFM